MYRSCPGCDHRFRSSKPRRTSRNAVDFFGFGGSRQSPGSPTDQPISSGQRIIEARSFRPSTVDLRPWLCSSQATPARELAAWTHVPSQSWTRSLLSLYQTSADISQRRRFFQVWRFRESPRSPTDQPTSGGQRFIEAYPFRPSTVDLPHWLCSSCQLLRESCRRGRMYRSCP
jgi:hypothetical protein